MAKTVKPTWRANISETMTEHIACDTLLPVDTYSKRTPLLFNIRPVPNYVIDLKNVRIFAKFRIFKLENNKWVPLAADKDNEVAYYNNFGYSVFEDAHLSVNGSLVETAQREYGRVNYLKNILYHSDDQSFESALYFKDGPGRMAEVVANATINEAEFYRWSSGLDGKSFSCIAPIGLDVFQSDGFLPEHVALTLKLFPAKTENCVLSSGADKDTKPLMVQIDHAELIVPRLKLAPSPTKSISVPYESTKVITLVNQKDVQSFSRSLNLNRLPSKLAITVLSEDQLSGKIGVNGYNFEPRKVKNLKVRCNGICFPSYDGITNDEKNKDYVQAYNSLHAELGVSNLPFPSALYHKNYAIYGINLKNEKNKTGSCDVDIIFSEKPKENLIIFVLCFFESKYSVDAHGTFHCDVPKV